MAVERLDDLSALEWILRPTPTEPENHSGGVRVDRCLPSFEAYAKILHPIWFTEASDSKLPIRILWSDLARRTGLQFHAAINASYFYLAPSGSAFVDQLRGPEEGRLGEATCQAILESIQAVCRLESAMFYYSGIGPPFETRLYRALPTEILLCPELEDVRTLPEYWWSADRTWCVCTDRDLTFTLVGGSAELVQSCMEHPFLECLPVSGGDRVDSYADVPNFRAATRQVAERILNGSLALSLGARAMVTLQSVGSRDGDLALSLFNEISRATVAIPLGPERQHWGSELLAKKDAELRRIESDYRALALSACREIVSTF